MIILCGMTCSGKSTIKKQLINLFNYKNILTYTDRPIRPNEKNGDDYNFITPEVFDRMIDCNEFVEHTSYNVSNSDRPWRYGTALKSFIDTNPNSVIILNPEGIEKVLKIFKNRKDIFVVYISSNLCILKNRLRNRGDDYQEADRRLRADIKDFTNIVEKSVNYTIVNNGEEPIAKIAFDIDMYYQCFLAKNRKK